jgi:hypothetical protein
MLLTAAGKELILTVAAKSNRRGGVLVPDSGYDELAITGTRAVENRQPAADLLTSNRRLTAGHKARPGSRPHHHLGKPGAGATQFLTPAVSLPGADVAWPSGIANRPTSALARHLGDDRAPGHTPLQPARAFTPRSNVAATREGALRDRVRVPLY